MQHVQFSSAINGWDFLSQQTTGSAAFLIGATIKNKAIGLYKPIPIVIANEERSSRKNKAMRTLQLTFTLKHVSKG